MSQHALATSTHSHLRSLLPEALQAPKLAVICGSGLGGLADAVEQASKVEFKYEDIPGFPRSTVAGHAGKLVFGFLGESKIPSVLMVGRAHFYEGHELDKVTFPMRLFKVLGVEITVVTNAAGALNPSYAVGDIMILNDHLFLSGFAGFHPLRGPNEDKFGPRFLPLSDAYDLDLRRQVHKTWTKIKAPENNRRVHEGVYAFVSGPSYETRAECRMLHKMGADCVGMSTVPEIIVARHCGIRVLALSLVTNNSVLSEVPRGDDPLIQNASKEELDTIISAGKANHEEVLEAGRLAAVDFQKLVVEALQDIFTSEK